MDFKLCVYNDTVEPKLVDVGDCLAVARAMPPELKHDVDANAAAYIKANSEGESDTSPASGSASAFAASVVESSPTVQVDERLNIVGEFDEREDIRIVSPCLDELSVGEHLYHLLQDEDLIYKIHNDELPPDCYYAMLQNNLAAKFPKSTKDARIHVVALCAAFDTASAFGLSFWY